MFPSRKFDKVNDKLWPKCSCLLAENSVPTHIILLACVPSEQKLKSYCCWFSISYTQHRRYNSDLEHSPLSFIVKQSQAKQNEREIMQPKTEYNTAQSHYWCAERDRNEEKTTMKNETNGCRLKCLASKEVSYSIVQHRFVHSHTGKSHDLHKYNSIRFQLLNELSM